MNYSYKRIYALLTVNAKLSAPVEIAAKLAKLTEAK